MTPDDIINENDGEQEEEQEQEPNIIDLNNYGMKPYSWRYEGSGGGGGSFNPDITDPQDGDTLVYDGTQQKWVNGAGGSGGGGAMKVTDTEGTLDKTWKELSDAFKAGQYVVIIKSEENNGMIGYLHKQLNVVASGSGTYMVEFGESDDYFATTENGYPALPL